MHLIARRVLLLLSCAWLLPMSASALMVTREFTGSWFDPAKVGQGFNLDIVNNSAGKTAVLYWYTFDGNGRPLWLYGQSSVADGDRVALSLFEVSGPRFAEDFTGSQLGLLPFGQIELRFASCNTANASYSGNLGTGSFNLVRLTQGFGGTCTGTLVDDGKATTLGNAPLNSSGIAETIRA